MLSNIVPSTFTSIDRDKFICRVVMFQWFTQCNILNCLAPLSFALQLHSNITLCSLDAFCNFFTWITKILMCMFYQSNCSFILLCYGFSLQRNVFFIKMTTCMTITTVRSFCSYNSTFSCFKYMLFIISMIKFT